MNIYDGNQFKEIINVVVNSKPITAIYSYVGNSFKIIWQAVRSCFGSGVWLNDRPWINTDAWKNNKYKD